MGDATVVPEWSTATAVELQERQAWQENVLAQEKMIAIRIRDLSALPAAIEELLLGSAK